MIPGKYKSRSVKRNGASRHERCVENAPKPVYCAASQSFRKKLSKPNTENYTNGKKRAYPVKVVSVPTPDITKKVAVGEKHEADDTHKELVDAESRLSVRINTTKTVTYML